MGDAAELERVKLYIGRVDRDLSLLDDPSNSFLRVFVERAAKVLVSDCSAGAKVLASASEADVVEEDKEGFEDDEIIESDIECEGGIVEPDNDPPQQMGDPSVVISEKDIKASEEEKAKAMEAVSEGKLEEAIEHLTDAILLNPFCPNLYETRAAVNIRMEKPNAAIRDAEAAMERGASSLEAYRSRAIALWMLGRWEEAERHLRSILLIKDDEELRRILEKVEPNARKIVEHRKKYHKLLTEREYKRQRAEAKKDKKEFGGNSVVLRNECGVTDGNLPGGGMAGGYPSYGFAIVGGGGDYGGAGPTGGKAVVGGGGDYGGAGPTGGKAVGGGGGDYGGAGPTSGKAVVGGGGDYGRAGPTCGYPGGGMAGGYPSGFMGGIGGYAGAGLTGCYPGACFPNSAVTGGGTAGGSKPAGVAVYKIFDDRELMATVQDPEVMPALRDVVKNPSGLRKYHADPKVAPFITKMMSKVGGPKWPE